MNPLTRWRRSGILMCLVLFLLASGSLQPVLGLPAFPSALPETATLYKVAAPFASGVRGDHVQVFVTLKRQAHGALSQGAQDTAHRRREMRNRDTIVLLRAMAAADQRDLLLWLKIEQARGRVSRVQPVWIVNGLGVTASPEVIQTLKERSDVESVVPDTLDLVPLGASGVTADLVPAAVNLALIGAPSLWELGIRGEGVVVATVDTGVDATHPELGPRWRGGTNSWYDPYGENPTPKDLAGGFSGHGTMVTGVMVAGDASGIAALGVAPQAQWVGVKIFNNTGGATRTAVHLGLQWLLDPDGDPMTPDAPHVAVNSWAFAVSACDLEFAADLQALRAGGVTPVVAAGNYGPNTGTSTSPANNPGALAVGATNNYDMIYFYSSRGPTACSEDGSPYPEIVAPGLDILTTQRYGGYVSETGTSLAAPHVAGALALLLSAYPQMSVSEQASLLFSTARDLGDSGADDVYGYGRLDVFRAYQTYVPKTYRVYLPFWHLPAQATSHSFHLPMVLRMP